MALATVDDMFTGILHFFGLTDRDSYTGRMLDAMQGKGATGVGTEAPGGNVKWRSKADINRAENTYSSQKQEGWKMRRTALWESLKPFGWLNAIPMYNVGSDMINKANQQLQYIKDQKQTMNMNYTVYVVDQTGGANANMQNIVVKTLEKFWSEHNSRFKF